MNENLSTAIDSNTPLTAWTPLTRNKRSDGIPPWETAFQRFVWGGDDQKIPYDQLDQFYKSMIYRVADAPLFGSSMDYMM